MKCEAAKLIQEQVMVHEKVVEWRRTLETL